MNSEFIQFAWFIRISTVFNWFLLLEDKSKMKQTFDRPILLQSARNNNWNMEFVHNHTFCYLNSNKINSRSPSVYRNVEFTVHLFFDKFCVWITFSLVYTRPVLGNSSKSATSVFLALFFFQILKYWFYKWKCVHKIITVKQNEDDDDDDADDDKQKKSFTQRNMHRIFIIWKFNIAQCWISSFYVCV